MRLIIDNQPILLATAAEMAGLNTWAADAKAIGVFKPGDERLRAVFVLQQYVNGGCTLTFVSDGQKRWMVPSLYQRVSRYIFLVEKLDRVTSWISVHNVPSLIIALKVGFQMFGRVPCGAIDGSDAIVLSMTRDQCPWLGKDE